MTSARKGHSGLQQADGWTVSSPAERRSSTSFNYLPGDDSALSSLITGRQAGVMTVNEPELSTFTIPPHPGLVDFSLFATETPDGPAGAIGYQLGSFDVSTAASLRRDFVRGVEATSRLPAGAVPR